MPRLDLSLYATAGLATTLRGLFAAAGSGSSVSDSNSISKFLLRFDLNSALTTSPAFIWSGVVGWRSQHRPTSRSCRR